MSDTATVETPKFAVIGGVSRNRSTVRRLRGAASYMRVIKSLRYPWLACTASWFIPSERRGRLQPARSSTPPDGPAKPAPAFARDRLLSMPPKYEVITFDCYGTLIDWESGIRQAFRDAARADGFALDDASIIPAYAEAEAVVEREAYRPYREILAESALRAAAKLGWKPRRPFLADSLGSWKPFPDTNAALERLAASGHRLGILSNVDDDLLSSTRRHFTVPFALIVTAQQVR